MSLEVREWADQPSWDAFVGSQTTGHYNQGWGWGDIAGPLGGRVFRRALTDGNKIRAVMSVAANSIKGSSRVGFHISRGPTVDEPTAEIMQLLMDDLSRMARKQNAVFAKIEPYLPAYDKTWPALLRTAGFSPLFPPSQPRSVWMIDLQPDLEEIQAGMKPKWRYNIRLAAKRGVEIVRGTEADIDDYYRLYQVTSRRDDFYIHDREIYRQMFRNFWNLGQFDLVMAKLGGEPIAAVTLITLGRTIWYAFGASSNEHREVMAPHALQWEAIKIGKERGALLYDLRGVPDVPGPDQEMSGVYRFKQGFGGYHETFLEQYARGYQAPLYGLWKAYWQGRYAVQSIQRRRQGLPHRQWA